jgi:hypothetical protein
MAALEQMNVAVPPRIKKALHAHARETGTTVRSLIVELVERHLRRDGSPEVVAILDDKESRDTSA